MHAYSEVIINDDLRKFHKRFYLVAVFIIYLLYMLYMPSLYALYTANYYVFFYIFLPGIVNIGVHLHRQ